MKLRCTSGPLGRLMRILLYHLILSIAPNVTHCPSLNYPRKKGTRCSNSHFESDSDDKEDGESGNTSSSSDNPQSEKHTTQYS